LKYSNIIVRGFRMYLADNLVRLKRKKINLTTLDSQPEKSEREANLHCRMYNLSQEGWQRIVTSNLSIKRRFLEEVGGFSRDFVFWGFEDVDLGYRLAKSNMKFVWDKKIKVYHINHSRESNLDMINAFWLGANILYRKYLDEEIYRVYSDVILHNLDKNIYENISH